MTREQALNMIIEGYDALKKAEEMALADNATVIDYCFKANKIVKRHEELIKRCKLMVEVLEYEVQMEMDLSSDDELQKD